MNTLPIVERELRVNARRGWLYWARSLFGLGGFLAALVIIAEGAPGQNGEAMLFALSFVALAFALFCGCVLTADCISSERRDETLGLLFLTTLKGYDVVFGKIAINAITTTCGLLAVFPIFFLPIMLGGVTWVETLRVLLAIAVSFLFALTFGVWVSARSREARSAMMATLGVVAVICVLPLIWIMIADAFSRGPVSFKGVPQLSPVMLMLFARESFYSAGNGTYWSSVALFAGASAVFAALASHALSRAWSLSPRGTERRSFGWVEQLRTRAQRARRRLQFDSVNPFHELFLSRLRHLYWGKAFHGMVSLFFWLMISITLAAGEDESYVLAIFVVFAMHVATKFVIAYDATQALSDDKRSSALEPLLITPLGAPAIAEGQASAFQKHTRGSVRRLVLMTSALHFVAMVSDELRMSGNDLVLMSGFFWGAMIWTWSDYKTAVWLGMPHALKQSNQLKAMLRTLATMLLLPWVPYFVMLLMMAEANADEAFVGVVTYAWAIGGAIYQRMRAKRMRGKLMREFEVYVGGPARPVAEKENRGPRKPAVFPQGSGAAWIADRV